MDYNKTDQDILEHVNKKVCSLSDWHQSGILWSCGTDKWKRDQNSGIELVQKSLNQAKKEG